MTGNTAMQLRHVLEAAKSGKRVLFATLDPERIRKALAELDVPAEVLGRITIENPMEKKDIELAGAVFVDEDWEV